MKAYGVSAEFLPHFTSHPFSFRNNRWSGTISYRHICRSYISRGCMKTEWFRREMTFGHIRSDTYCTCLPSTVIRLVIKAETITKPSKIQFLPWYLNSSHTLKSPRSFFFFLNFKICILDYRSSAALLPYLEGTKGILSCGATGSPCRFGGGIKRLRHSS